jgi:integrase
MRVSDLLMLKIGNFKNGRLEYVMYKTGAPISMPININMALIISDLSKDLPKYTEFIKSEKIQIKDENNEIHEIGLTKLKRLILSLCNKTYKYNPMVNQYLSKLERSVESNMSRTINYKGYEIMKDDVKVKELIDAKEKLEENINTSFLNSLYYSIKRMQKMHKNEFLFPILRLKSFGDYTNYLSLEQYKNLKHATIVYNRHLKKVQDVCDIETNLSSHISRHTFTNLLLQMSGVNLYDVSLSLGHSNIKITEQYLRTGFNAEKLDVLNTGLADKFRKQN